MEKLMDADPYKRAIPKKLINDDMFGDTYPTCSTTCEKQTDCDDCPIQEAFAKLGRYEQTGLDPDQIQELKERDTAKVPVDTDDEFDMYVCPNCDMAIETMGNREEHHFCLNCGQRLKWEE